MKQYLNLLEYTMKNGCVKNNRTNISTISVFSQHLKHDMVNGVPILTTKRLVWKNIVIEMLWFLSGDRNNKFFEKHGITFWRPWQDENGDLPVAYGEYWRGFPGCLYRPHDEPFDQYKAIIEELQNNPNSRRLVIDRWHAAKAWDEKLPPCFFASVFNVQYDKNGNKRLCLHSTGRSVDVPVGFPYNLAGFGLFLELTSHLVGITPGEISFTLVDCHIYDNQKNGVVEQLQREPGQLPHLIISPDMKTLEDLDALIKDGTTEQIMDTFKIENYNPAPFIRFPVAI